MGSGLTRKPVISFDDENDLSDPELAEAQKAWTWEGQLNVIEEQCFATLRANDLPAEYGWRRFEGGRTCSLWTVAKSRGFKEDSAVGFASRMLDDIYFLRRALAGDDKERAMQFAFWLGVKQAEWRIKRFHGERSRPIVAWRHRERDIAMAREFLRRRQRGTGLSDSALKGDVGADLPKPLARSTAIEAIDRGLKFLSG